jgi:hypothetical protein
MSPLQPPYLSPFQWEVLALAEAEIYHGQHGAHAYTSVTGREDGTVAYELWKHASFMLECSGESDELSIRELTERIAARVAPALAVLAFGLDFLPTHLLDQALHGTGPRS